MVSGHKSKTHITIFFLKILFNKIIGIALSIGEGQKMKIKSIFFLEELSMNKKDKIMNVL